MNRKKKLETELALSRAIGIIHRQFMTIALMSGMKLENYKDEKYENMISTYIKEINQLIECLPDIQKEDCKELCFTDVKGLEEWLRRMSES